MSYQLEPAQLEDLPAMIAWEEKIFGSDAWPPELLTQEVTNPNHYYVVAKNQDGQDVVGYAGLAADPLPGGHGDIQTIAVAPEHRGKGLGRLLLRALLEKADTHKVVRVFLEVRADNEPAISLYRSEGFTPIDRRVGYYQPDGVDAVVMSKDLVHGPEGWAVGRG